MEDGIGALDPRRAGDQDAIRALLRRRRQAFSPELRAFALRVRGEAGDDGLRLDALNVLASAAVVSGDDEDGARLFGQALDASWGTGSHGERVACVNLVMILARQRRLVEAFALARHACRLALATAEPLAACLAHAQLAKVLLELGDAEGFERAVTVAERHRPPMDETLRGWVPHLLAGLHAEVALLRGDAGRAADAMEAALDRPDVIRDVVDLGRAGYLRRTGRPAEALRVVRRAIADGPTDPSYGLRFRAEELLCLLDLDDGAALRERAAGCLAEMAREGRRCGTSIWRMRIGETVGRALAADERSRDAARQAFEIAAVAALERSWESKLFFRDFPQLERMEPEDLALIEAYSERFQAEHRELLAALRALLADGARSETAFGQADPGSLFVSICAWCNRVNGPERAWIPLDAFVAPSGALDVTHGICRGCTAGLRAGLAPRAPRPERTAAQAVPSAASAPHAPSPLGRSRLSRA